MAIKLEDWDANKRGDHRKYLRPTVALSCDPYNPEVEMASEDEDDPGDYDNDVDEDFKQWGSS